MMSDEFSPALCETTLRSFSRVRECLEARCGNRSRPLIVGVGGPGGCGKSTFSRWLAQEMEGVAVLSLDDFRFSRELRSASGRFGSHPEGNDLSRLEEVLEDAKEGRRVLQPVFDAEHGRVIREEPLPAFRLLLADGEIAAHTHLRHHFDLFILVNAHWRTQLNTRLSRDVNERHCSLEKAIHLFLQSNLRDYPTYAAGVEEAADVVLYRSVKHVFTLKRLPG